MHNDRLVPVSGPGIHPLNRGEFKTLGVYNTHGNTPRASQILDNMGMDPGTRAKVIKIYNTF